MLIQKHFAISVWLLLICWFATPPPFLRADDECRKALPSFSVRYAALFYKIVGRFLIDAISHQTLTNAPVFFGKFLLKELDRKVKRVSGLARNAQEANEWKRLVVQNNILRSVYFLASQALTYHEAYTTIRAENNLQTQLADEQLAEENILEVLRNIHSYFSLPTIHSEILKYELLETAQRPLVALIINASAHRPELLVDLKYSYSKFLYEPEVAEQPYIVGYFRTPIEVRPDLNVFNDYAFLLRALSGVECELNALTNRSRSPTYSDYFLAIVPFSVLARAQTFVRKLSADSPLTNVVEYKLIVTTFLHILLEFLFHEYNWQYCHPVRRQLTPLLEELWEQIVTLINNNKNSYKNAYNAYVMLPNLHDKMKALYESLKKDYKIQVGYTLRAGIGAAIADLAEA